MAKKDQRGTRLRKLTPREYQHLWDKIRDTSLPVRIYNRYRVILRANHRESAASTARLYDLNWKTVVHWIQAFNKEGFKSFERPNNPKGREKILTGTDVKRLMSLVSSRPKDLGLPFTQWSISKLNAYGQKTQSWDKITDEGLRGTLQRHGITFQRTGTWKESPDPDFARKKNESRRSRNDAPEMVVS